MTVEQALERLAASMSEAVVEVLRRAAGGAGVGASTISDAPDVHAPLSELDYPAVVLDAMYPPPLAGAVAVALPEPVARRLSRPAAGDRAVAGELDLDALALLARSCTRAAADAAARLVGAAVRLGVPRTRRVTGPDEAAADLPPGTHVVSARVELWGMPCELLQLVPDELVVRFAREDDELLAGDPEEAVRDALRAVPVRLWAELGRVRMTMGELVSLPEGALVELDQEVDAPVGLCVGDTVVGSGRLVVLDDGELALRVDRLAGPGR